MYHTKEDFERNISKTPEDKLLYEVYYDWLNDRGEHEEAKEVLLRKNFKELFPSSHGFNVRNLKNYFCSLYLPYFDEELNDILYRGEIKYFHVVSESKSRVIFKGLINEVRYEAEESYVYGSSVTITIFGKIDFQDIDDILSHLNKN